MKRENLIEKAAEKGLLLEEELKLLSGIKEVRGRGLMIGIEMENPVSELRKKLLFEHHIFTGSAAANIIRLLPPLCVTDEEIDQFLTAFKSLI
jgi:acetylornithine aminotransferase